MKKLMRDLKDCQDDTYKSSFVIRPHTIDNIGSDGTVETSLNLMHWHGLIYGPSGSVYEDGKFKIDIQIPSNYPMNPPMITFLSKIIHPNIKIQGGAICLSVLKKGGDSGWSPVYGLHSTVLCIHSLLAHPNPEDPLEGSVAREYIEDRRKFEEHARSETILQATCNEGLDKKLREENPITLKK
jgi:ubiquitin-protein ligase